MLLHTSAVRPGVRRPDSAEEFSDPTAESALAEVALVELAGSSLSDLSFGQLAELPADLRREVLLDLVLGDEVAEG